MDPSHAQGNPLFPNRLLWKERGLGQILDQFGRPFREALEKEKVDPDGLQELLNQKNPGACGVTAIQDTQGASRENVDILLKAACQNDQRGGKIRDKRGRITSDGAGAMLRTDNDAHGRGMQDVLHEKAGRQVPLTKPSEQLHCGFFFIDPGQGHNIDAIQERIAGILYRHGLHALRWTAPVTNPDAISGRARSIMPIMREVIFAEGETTDENIEEALFKARLEISTSTLLNGVDIVSLQPGTRVWKIMGQGSELAEFYPELKSPKVISDGGMVQTRFGTNVLARWILAQPFEKIAHNGEVNTINVLLETLFFLEQMKRLTGSNVMKAGSDSANLDRAVQFLTSRGLGLAEAIRIMMHPSADDLKKMNKEIQKYFRAVSRILPSLKAIGSIALFAMDRKNLVVTLDNRGNRPLVGMETRDGKTIWTSERSGLGIETENISEFMRLHPGEQALHDRKGTKLIGEETDMDTIRKTTLPYRKIALRNVKRLDIGRIDTLTSARIREEIGENPNDFIARQNLFGLSNRRLKMLMDLIKGGQDPVRGMGTDRAQPGLSPEPHSLGNHLRAGFSQVSNPSLSYKEEGSSFTLKLFIGPTPIEVKFFQDYVTQPQYEREDPLVDDGELVAAYADPKTLVISTVFEGRTEEDCFKRLEAIKEQVLHAAESRTFNQILFSDRNATGENRGYIPPHLIAAYIKSALNKAGDTNHVGIMFDTGEVLNQHEFAMLVACGAGGVHPRLIYELIERGEIDRRADAQELKAQLRAAFDGTLIRYMAKTGIDDVLGYMGGKNFSTLGLDNIFVKRFFGDIGTNHGGIPFKKILEDQFRRGNITDALRKSEERHGLAKQIRDALEEVGELSKKEGGPKTPQEAYELFLDLIEENGPLSSGDLLELKTDGREIDINEVISEEEIIRKIIRGAGMSLGALNDESHRAVQLLFNTLGSYAIEGEGGMPSDRKIGEKWEKAASVVPQFASARFGADVERLADPRVKRIEIKIVQGAKPGVGGQLPGEKVMHLVAQIRGVGLGQTLISPPTNHDIYSIEDLEALIQHLGALNPAAVIDVKIGAGENVDNIAIGVAKAQQNSATDLDMPIIGISGDRGGTAAATDTDRDHTGIPREDGLAQVHNRLVQQGMRSRVELRSDAGIRCGKDIVKDLIFGGNEIAAGLWVLITQQKCIYCASCNAGNCPAFITRGQSEFLGQVKDKLKRQRMPADEKMETLVLNGAKALYMLAHDVRRWMAKLGRRTPEELIGKRELLEVPDIEPDLANLETQLEEAKRLIEETREASPMLAKMRAESEEFRALKERVRRGRNAVIAQHFDWKPFLETPRPVFTEEPLLAGILDRVTAALDERMGVQIEKRIGEKVYEGMKTIRRRISEALRIAEPEAEKLYTLMRRKKEHFKNPNKFNTNHVEFYLASPRVNRPNRKIIEAVLSHPLNSGKPCEVDLGTLSGERSIGATIAGLKVKGVIPWPKAGVVIKSRGFAGLGFGFGICDGITMIHRGTVEGECADIQCGGKIVILSPNPERSDMEIGGNTVGYGSRGGDRFIQGSSGSRNAILQRRGRTIYSGNVSKFAGEGMTGGRMVVLGKVRGEFMAGASGGESYVRDPDIKNQLAKAAMISSVMPKRDLNRLRKDLEDFAEATGDRETLKILANWENESKRFRKIIARESYEISMFKYLHTRYENMEYTDRELETLVSDLLELCGYDSESESPVVRRKTTDIRKKLVQGLEALRTEIKEKNIEKPAPEDNTKVDEIEKRFKLTKEHAKKLTLAIEKELQRP